MDVATVDTTARGHGGVPRLSLVRASAFNGDFNGQNIE